METDIKILISKAQAEFDRLEHLKQIALENELDNGLIPILSSQRTIEKIFGYKLTRGILGDLIPDRIRVFLEVDEVEGDIAITEVEERDENSFTYVDDKLMVTIYSELAIGFSEGLYIGMYLAMKKD